MSTANIIHPPVAAAAFDVFMRFTAPMGADQPHWRPEDGPMPALYLGHGAPP